MFDGDEIDGSLFGPAGGGDLAAVQAAARAASLRQEQRQDYKPRARPFWPRVRLNYKPSSRQASRAADSSARFLLRPWPRARTCSSTRTSMTKVFLWGSPVSSTTL